ncbi:DUF739 domain-containing protein [Dolosigranulum pigrum]|jgi:putative cro repressor|uniref:DUF739 family protein n=1 Tax=Dolosigranulum pigrum TaxID=29394 RepID=UPI000DBFF9D3|nr:DUF739 family protein [Dolosigranulum pigrum]RAN53811.1 DUF739 domain-containing protein [Dolosigranulum pigrum]
MSFNYSKLKGRIIEKYGTQRNFAREMNLSEKTLSSKLKNVTSWKNDDISRACDLLEIPMEEIPVYFFEVEVQ